MDEQRIMRSLKENGLPDDRDLAVRLNVYFSMLAEWNRKMDLTATEEEQEVLDRHFIDSLTVLRGEWLNDCRRLIDVGTGAGFPGMPIALARPGIQVVLLDSQRKRLSFLEAVKSALGADNVTLVHDRAEDGARRKELRESFDVAVARAVAPLNVLCEYLLPFVRIGGTALCWKGPALSDEWDAGIRAAHLLGGKPGEAMLCPVAGREWDHRIQPIRKIRRTPPGYPRKAGTPKVRPLGEN